MNTTTMPLGDAVTDLSQRVLRLERQLRIVGLTEFGWWWIGADGECQGAFSSEDGAARDASLTVTLGAQVLIVRGHREVVEALADIFVVSNGTILMRSIERRP